MIAVPSAAVNRLSAVPPAALFFLPGHGTGRKKSSFGMIYILGQSCIKVENIWSESMLSDPQAYACGEISRCGRGRAAMTETIIIKPSVRKQFDSFMAHGRVLFFSAPCGFGKTVLADALLRGQKVLRLNAGAPDFLRVRITFCGCTRAEKSWHLYTSKRFLLFCDFAKAVPVTYSAPVSSLSSGILSGYFPSVRISYKYLLSRIISSRISCQSGIGVRAIRMTARIAPTNAAAPMTANNFLLSFFFAALQISAAQATQTAAAKSAMPSVSHSQDSSYRIFMRSSSPVR